MWDIPANSQRKAALSDNDAVINDTVALAYLENFALRVFLSADNEDRDAKATRYASQYTLTKQNYSKIIHCCVEFSIYTSCIWGPGCRGTLPRYVNTDGKQNYLCKVESCTDFQGITRRYRTYPWSGNKVPRRH